MILLVLGIFLIFGLWGIIFRRWQSGVVMLLVYMPFAGVVTLSLYPSPLPTLFKDIFFVIPAYLAFFLTRKNETVREYVPGTVLIAMLALAEMVFIQSANSGVANWMVAVIGAKVWLFYLPLLFLAFAMLESIEDLITLFRLMVVIAWIPCCVGIVQWIASMTFGYVATMTAFYGEAAQGATQGFVSFDVGGSIFRIPSTFTFVTQYFGFTLGMIVPAYALMNMDTSEKWRRIATVTFWLVILASILSGARAAYLFVPILIALIYSLEGKLGGMLKVTIMLPVAMLMAMSIAGINPIKMFDMSQELFLNYSDEIAQKGLLDAIQIAPFGTGTGMNTGPARYAFADPDSFIAIENYYAKAVIELGIAGLVVVVALIIILMVHGYRIHRQIQDAGLRSCSAAFLAFIIMMTLNSFKGWQIDLDPINVYFWVFSGFLLKLEYLDKLVQVSSDTGQQTVEEYREPAPQILRPTSESPCRSALLSGHSGRSLSE